jgi:F-type H+-transporting ATPase subunit b
VEFDWTTFALEALNFLVLVWLLKRFFYRPVLAVIEARRAENAKTIADAETLRGEAEALKGEYSARLATVDQDRAAARAGLDAEIAAERERRLAAVEVEVNADRQRRQMLETREESEREAALEREAVAIAARFATRLLDRLAGPELEGRLADLALSELDTQAQDKVEALRAALRDSGAGIRVVSAYALDAARRAALTETLGKLAGRSVEPEFSQDPQLKAGVCILAGAWVLMANLRDELAFFAGGLEHGG